MALHPVSQVSLERSGHGVLAGEVHHTYPPTMTPMGASTSPAAAISSCQEDLHTHLARDAGRGRAPGAERATAPCTDTLLKLAREAIVMVGSWNLLRFPSRMLIRIR